MMMRRERRAMRASLICALLMTLGSMMMTGRAILLLRFRRAYSSSFERRSCRYYFYHDDYAATMMCRFTRLFRARAHKRRLPRLTPYHADHQIFTFSIYARFFFIYVAASTITAAGFHFILMHEAGAQQISSDFSILLHDSRVIFKAKYHHWH